MFIHKKRHRSGAYSIEVLRKDRCSRKNVTVKIIGTSSNAQELLALERKAREFIDSQLGLPIPMDYHYPFEDGLESFLSGISNLQIQVIGPELIYGRLYDKIGYSGINNEMFRHLVICRLFNPGSKLRTVEYLRQYLNKDYDVEAIYKFLDNLCFRKDNMLIKSALGGAK